MTLDPELIAAIAHHEAGHAVASVVGWSSVVSPINRPPSLVKFAEITDEGLGKFSGVCNGPSIFHPLYPSSMTGHWQDAVQWQLVQTYAGPVAEAIHRGERSKASMWFAVLNCGADGDLIDAANLIKTLREITRRQFTETRFAEQARKLMIERWAAVSAVAQVLIKDRRIEGNMIEHIVRGEESK